MSRAKLQRLKARHAALKTQRDTGWMTHWRELAEYIHPRGFRGLGVNSRENAGQKKQEAIINSTATWALRTAAAGIMSGLSSPSRTWFRLTVGDSSLIEAESVKEWLSKSETVAREKLQRSNLYNCLHACYWEDLLQGTAVCLIEEDEATIFRGYMLPTGSYCLTTDATGRVNGLFHETGMTVEQLEDKFGLEALSTPARQAYEAGNRDMWVDVVHAISPNEEYTEGRIGPNGFKWASCWYEAAATEGYLGEGGYHEFPVLAPRWAVTGEDVYGHGPGMEALGDVKAIQFLEKRKAQLADKLSNPPMRGPSSLLVNGFNLVPGGFTAVDSPTSTIEPAISINPQAVGVVADSIARHEERVKAAFFADLWLLMSQAEGQMTAREVAERREEKLLQLGPVTERLQAELLNPLFERVMAILARAGLLPTPPQELRGREVVPEYLSIMAQAQKLQGTLGLERLTGFAAQLAPVVPAVADKVDWDQAVDEYALMLGVPPSVVRPDDEVEALRQQRAQAQQAQQQMAQAQQAADVGQTLSKADTSGDNALTQMLRGLGAQ